jgi:hypothetical protein
VIECAPAASEEVAYDATPALSVPDPSAVVPSRKVTVPPGTPATDEAVAVNVTGAETNVGFVDNTSTSAGAAFATVNDTVAVAVV